MWPTTISPPCGSPSRIPTAARAGSQSAFDWEPVSSWQVAPTHTAIAMCHHERFMQQAIDVARSNPTAPFGTVLVDRRTDSVATKGLNRATENPIVHGELDAIIRYAAYADPRWQDLRLYTTAEPCCMCQAAIMWAGIPEVVFGTSIATLMELGWDQFDLRAIDVAKSAAFAECQIVGGVFAEQCDQLFKEAKA